MGGALGASQAATGGAIIRGFFLRASALANTTYVIGTLTAANIQQLIISSGDRVVTLFTRLSQSPAVNRQLQTAMNQNLCNALPNPQATQTFIARIPQDLFQRLLLEGHIRSELVTMGNVRDHAYVISADAMRILHPYFQAAQGGAP